MVDPKRIERLWAACPELKPAAITEFYSSFSSIPPNEVVCYIGAELVEEDVYEALIRDKIAEWLEKYAVSIIRDSFSGQWCSFLRTSTGVGDYSGPRITHRLGKSERTEVHIVAAESILGLEPWKP